MELHEPIIRALVERLAADLPDVIDGLNAAGGDDGLAVDPPGQVLDYVPTLTDLAVFPTVGIQDIRSELTDDIGSSVTGVHQLGVLAFLADPDQRRLAWGLRRYMRAVVAVALRDRNLGDAAYGTGLTRIEWGPTLADQEDPRTWMSWAAAVVWARADDA